MLSAVSDKHQQLKAHQVKVYDFFGVQVLHALQQSGAVVASAGKQISNATDWQAHLLTNQPQVPIRAGLLWASTAAARFRTQGSHLEKHKNMTSPGKCCHNSSPAPAGHCRPSSVQDHKARAEQSRTEQTRAAPMAGQRI